MMLMDLKGVFNKTLTDDYERKAKEFCNHDSSAASFIYKT